MLRLQRLLLPAALLLASSVGHAEQEQLDEPKPRPSIDAALAGMPNDPSRGLRVEGALLVADFKALFAWSDHRKAVHSQTKAGAAYHQATFTVGGVDLSGELRQWVSWAAPGEQPVPGGLAAYSMAPGGGVQLFMRVQPGFLERVQASLAQRTQAGWARSVEGDRITAEIFGTQLVGRVDQLGWLRLSIGPDMLVGASPGGEPLFAPAMAQRMALLEAVLFVRGGGLASMLLSTLASEWGLKELVSSTRTLAMGWRWDGEKTSELQLLLDNPDLARLAADLRAPALDDSLLSTWDSDVTQFFSLALPPRLYRGLLDASLQEMERMGPLTPELRSALEAFEGRLGVAMFGSPGDWAVAMQLASPEQAQTLLPHLHAYLTAVAASEGVRLRSAQMETFPGLSSPVWRQRPNLQLEGMRLVQLGSNVVLVNQTARLSSLVARAQGSAAGFDHHLTPMVANRLRQPAMLQGYMVMGNDGALMDVLATLVGLVVDGWDLAVKDRPDLAEYDEVIRQLPTLISLEGFTLALMYDAAVTADLLDGILSLQLLSSEI